MAQWVTLTLAVVLGAGIFGSACDRQPPLSRAQAEALADAQIRKIGADWGRARHIELSPEESARRFWVVHYAADHENGEPRVVAVNYRSGWTRFVAASDPMAISSKVDVAPSVVLLVDEVSRDEWNDGLLQQWQTRVQTLNQQVREEGGVSAYQLRQTAHSWQLVWGWNEGRGMRPAPSERRALHGRHPGAQWITIEAEG